MKKYLKRLRSPATIMGITSYIITIITTLGFQFDSESLMIILHSICSILVLLGIMNNPETKGVDFPNKK